MNPKMTGLQIMETVLTENDERNLQEREMSTLSTIEERARGSLGNQHLENIFAKLWQTSIKSSGRCCCQHLLFFNREKQATVSCYSQIENKIYQSTREENNNKVVVGKSIIERKTVLEKLWLSQNQREEESLSLSFFFFFFYFFFLIFLNFFLLFLTQEREWK